MRMCHPNEDSVMKCKCRITYIDGETITMDSTNRISPKKRLIYVVWPMDHLEEKCSSQIAIEQKF